MPPRISSDFITTTANVIDGYDVVETFGIVRGIVVRSRSVFGTLGAVLQTMRGGNISMLQELCERTRADAYSSAVEHARVLGANALLAMRYDATEIMQGVSEVLCYGTAVRVAPRLRSAYRTEDVNSGGEPL
jgi:uncharacterized protein YbjQ (UPF0145 family)